MEGVFGASAVGRGIGKRLDHLVKLHDGTWPAMGDHQRERVLMRRLLVDEMDVQPVDLGDELIKAVERGLTRPPVVCVGPVVGQVAGVIQGNALAPVVHAFGFRPPGSRQTRLQISKNVVGNLDAKRLHPFIVPPGVKPATRTPITMRCRTPRVLLISPRPARQGSAARGRRGCSRYPARPTRATALCSCWRSAWRTVIRGRSRRAARRRRRPIAAPWTALVCPIRVSLMPPSQMRTVPS